jgi:predicted metal-binding membrane protein
MLALGALMALEKNVAWGRRVSAPIGVALVSGAAVLTGAAMLNLG